MRNKYLILGPVEQPLKRIAVPANPFIRQPIRNILRALVFSGLVADVVAAVIVKGDKRVALGQTFRPSEMDPLAPALASSPASTKAFCRIGGKGKLEGLNLGSRLP